MSATQPKECPGAQSEQAGKASACAGCPNRAICASGAARKPDPTAEDVKSKLSGVKHTIVVLSGKGGVGKSTVSSQLAFTLASRGFEVGLLDIDICGPSIPRMLGLNGEEVHQSGSGWSPVYVEDNLGVMSIGFMLPKEDDAVIWRGPRKNGLIKQFLTDVDWGTLDYLIIDTPPGTSDEHISIAQYLKGVQPDGAVVVTTPQEVAVADVRKELSFCKKVGMNILGVVENMSGFVCPGCSLKTQIFKATGGGAENMCKTMSVKLQMSIPFLGKLPLDPLMLQSCESGEGFVAKNPESPTSDAFNTIVDGVVKRCEA